MPNLHVESVAPTSSSRDDISAAGREAIERAPVAICIYVDDVPATARESGPVYEQLVREMNQAGILVVTMGRQLGTDALVFAHVGVDYASAAEKVGKRLAEIAGDKHSYVLLHARDRSPADSRTYDAFSAGTISASLMSRLTDRQCRPGGAAQLEQVRAMIDTFPNTGLIVTLSPEAWLVMPDDEHLDPRNRFVALSTLPRLWPRLRSGEAAALAGPLHGDIGFLAASKAWDGLIGGEAYGRIHLVPCRLITRENLNDFAREYAAAAGLSTEERSPAVSEDP